MFSRTCGTFRKDTERAVGASFDWTGTIPSWLETMRFTARTATITWVHTLWITFLLVLTRKHEKSCLLIYGCCTPIWSNLYESAFRHVRDFICQRAQHTDSCFIKFSEMLPNGAEISERFSLSNGSGGGSASYEAWTHASRSRERAVRETQRGQMARQEDPGSTNLYPLEDLKLCCKSSGGNIPVEGAHSECSLSIYPLFLVKVLHKRSCRILDVKWGQQTICYCINTWLEIFACIVDGIMDLMVCWSWSIVECQQWKLPAS